MSSRREEIEAKRLKLQRLRQQRQERELREKGHLDNKLLLLLTPLSPQADKLIDELIGGSADSSRQSIDTSVERIFSRSDEKAKYVTVGVQTDGNGQGSVETAEEVERGKHRSVEMYDKSVQTEDFQIQNKETQERNDQRKLKELEREIRNEIEQELKHKEELKQQLAEQRVGKYGVESDSDSEAEDYFELRSKDLGEESGNATKLAGFFNRSFKLVNRALEEDGTNLLRDYGVEVAEDAGTDTLEPTHLGLGLFKSIYNENFCDKRAINSLDWSGYHKELIVGAYSEKGRRSTGINEFHDTGNFDQSSVLVWNINYNNNLPEYKFLATTEILSVLFNEENPCLIYGGGYNGKVFCWDTRVNQETPSLTSGGEFCHTGAVYSLKHQREKKSSHDASVLISSSADGTLCSWSPYSLKSPIGRPIQLKAPGALLSRYDILTPTCIAYNISGALVGCEDGRVYKLRDWNIYNPNVTEKSAAIQNIFEGHKYSPITSIDYNSHEDYHNLFLTSGFDWNIKLWRNDNAANDDIDVELIPPIAEIQRDDIVMDVKWRPNSISQFAAAGGSGELELYDFTVSTATPVVAAKPPRHTAEESLPLFSIVFGDSGSLIATGGTDGYLNIFKIEDRGELDEEKMKLIAGTK